MNQNYILFGIVILLLLYLIVNNYKKDKNINMNLYNPFVITNNQTRQITELLNKKMEKNIDDKKWISDDIMVKKCYNICQGNYDNDYVKCINECKTYETF
tara:strand:+ start:269 stop:568 length:300 start_codon:yes stop_codon:yes gene_type:complete